jgi:hypothetical protein
MWLNNSQLWPAMGWRWPDGTGHDRDLICAVGGAVLAAIPAVSSDPHECRRPVRPGQGDRRPKLR